VSEGEEKAWKVAKKLVSRNSPLQGSTDPRNPYGTKQRLVRKNIITCWGSVVRKKGIENLPGCKPENST